LLEEVQQAELERRLVGPVGPVLLVQPVGPAPLAQLVARALGKGLPPGRLALGMEVRLGR